MTETLIKAGTSPANYWNELWRYRELFVFLVWRDLLVRYKQTIVGIAWSVLRPLLTMAILTVVFGSFSKLPSGGTPYALLVFSGLLPWQFLSTAISESGASLVGNANLISKIYFPRIIVPASSIATSFVDFGVSLIILAGLMIWFGVNPPTQILLLPFFLLQLFLLSFGFGLWISSLMVEYRDFKFIVPFVVQLGLYVSPVAFSSTVVPEQWSSLYALNPAVGIIDAFRWCLLGNEHRLNLLALQVSLALTIVLLVTGFAYFRRVEKKFADLI